MKRKFALMPAFLALDLLAGCSNNDLPLGMSSTKEVYGFQAMTAVNLLSMDSSSASILARRSSMTQNEEEKQEILHYLEFSSKLLNGDNPFMMEESVSDKTEYEKKTIITVKDLQNNNLEYVMYYNEVLEKDDDHDEQEFNINGIIIFDNVSYEIRGERESENDEHEISLTAKLSDTHFVTVEQESENGEIEYQYSVRKDGKASSFSVEIEDKRYGQEITIQKEENNKEKEYIYRLKNSSLIEVTVKENDRVINSYEIEVTYENNTPIYSFK